MVVERVSKKQKDNIGKSWSSANLIYVIIRNATLNWRLQQWLKSVGRDPANSRPVQNSFLVSNMLK